MSEQQKIFLDIIQWIASGRGARGLKNSADNPDFVDRHTPSDFFIARE